MCVTSLLCGPRADLLPFYGCLRFSFILYRLNVTQLVTLLLDSKLVSVLCHFGNFGCGDGGWTPVMKMDGNNVRHLCTFSLSLATRVEKNVLLIINYRFASVSGNFQLS